MKMSKTKFHQILNSIQDLNNAKYIYVDSCNDPFSHVKKQPKSAKYAFYLEADNESILIEDGYFYKKTHEDKEKELIKKFSRWAKQWKSKYL